jgi:NADPH:quinone reductase-like Zn-dependent oxidoreductase
LLSSTDPGCQQADSLPATKFRIPRRTSSDPNEGPPHFEPLAALCVAGHVGIHIDRTLALEEAPEALRYLGEGCALGKVVVEVNND